MQTIEIYNKKWCRILVDLEKNRLITHWYGFTVFEQFAEAIDACVKAFHDYDLHSVLSDTKKQQIISEKEKNYAVQAMRKLMTNGLRRMAFVMPESMAAAIVVDEFKAEFPKEMVKHFESYPEAINWLNEQFAKNAA